MEHFVRNALYPSVLQEKLPEYFQPWNDLASRIVELMKSKTVREHIDQLEMLDHKRLSGRAELFLAHLQLSRFVAGYVWQNGKSDPAKKIPRCIAVPFYGISDSLSIRPTISYCDIVLANWRPIDPKAPLTFVNIRPIISLPGGKDADNLIRQTAAVELAFTPAIQRTLDAVYATEAGDASTLAHCLEDVAAVLRKMTAMLSDIHELIDAEALQNVVLLYCGGFGPGSPLPEGLLFEGVSDEGVTAIGASAAQTSALQLVDAALSVQHTQDNRAIFQNHRLYMPQKHRQFVETVEQRSQIRQYVTSCKDEALTSAFKNCLRCLADFRSGHIRIITKYVVMVSKNDPGNDKLVSYLKSARDETTNNEHV
ncbi:Myoglobin [Mizuhopecten yessoensis]|uniref:Myoglobin n=1 Tax=Mizuhopecten yessoensis TaxID=6573 RepID=A0A210QMN2_MIZYE|nr:Myoglobin [Mizuhopecten yessoensis]